MKYSLFQSGAAAPPSSVILARQRLVMEQLKDRLNIDVSLSDKTIKKI